MKKFLSIMMVMLLVVATMTACGTKPAASDMAYIEENGKMVIGYTVYEPMNYYDDNEEFVGFDTELAKVVKNLALSLNSLKSTGTTNSSLLKQRAFTVSGMV